MQTRSHYLNKLLALNIALQFVADAAGIILPLAAIVMIAQRTSFEHNPIKMVLTAAAIVTFGWNIALFIWAFVTPPAAKGQKNAPSTGYTMSQLMWIVVALALMGFAMAGVLYVMWYPIGLAPTAVYFIVAIAFILAAVQDVYFSNRATR